jgi:hypothetical protein
MDNTVDNKLIVKREDGNDLSITVLDIFDSEDEQKQFIIYSVEDNEDNIFASILVEDENSYELKTIENEEDAKLVNKRIEEITKEIQ